MSNNKTKYNKSTYIGHIKMKNGGMKIIADEIDSKIIEKRNKILSHLDNVLSGGGKLKEKHIEKYFRALGGKYIRNDICTSGNTFHCDEGKNITITGADKLLKLSSKNNLPIGPVLKIFKGSAPTLYEKLEMKILGGKRGGNKKIESESDDNYGMLGGAETNNQNLFEIELNKLREEIALIRGQSF